MLWQYIMLSLSSSLSSSSSSPPPASTTIVTHPENVSFLCAVSGGLLSWGPCQVISGTCWSSSPLPWYSVPHCSITCCPSSTVTVPGSGRHVMGPVDAQSQSSPHGHCVRPYSSSVNAYRPLPRLFKFYRIYSV